MCDRYSFFGSVEMLTGSFGIEDMDTEPLENFNISPSQFVPAILNKENRVQLKHLHWGLIPSWANDPEIGIFMINAREDSLSLMPCFRDAFKSRRCIIPASGYFEWTNENGIRQPYFITGKNNELFGFAGLWEQWTDVSGGNHIESFTIITRDAIPEITHLNDRMPVILTKDDYRDWLDPNFTDFDSLAKLLKTGKESNLKIHKVSSDVNSTLNNSPELVCPVTVEANTAIKAETAMDGATDIDGSIPPKQELAHRFHKIIKSLLSALVG